MSSLPPSDPTLRTARMFEGYTPSEMTEASEFSRAENPRWRWLFPVTRASRDFIQVQLRALQIAYALAVPMIYLAAQSERVVSAWLLNVWLAESVVNLALRSLLYIPLVRASPVAIASRPLLRLIPVFAMAAVGAHWVWTVLLLVGTSLNLTTLVVLMSFVMLSVTSVAILPASPATCILYLLFLWVPMTFKLAGSDWITPPAVAALLVTVTACLWATFHIVVTAVRKYLVQSDEIELLVTQLRDRNGEVESLQRAAASDLETRTAFFTSASHDFRQRVHAMKLLTQLSVSEGPAPGSDRSASIRLMGVVDDLETYITDVLEFAKLEGTTLKPERHSVRIQSLFQQLDVEFEDIALERSVDLQLRATTLQVNSDEAMLLRILENLTSNALKFTKARVLIAARRCQGNVCIEVRDQGPGILPDAVDAVFEAFYQTSEATHHDRKGVGLGLAIVKRLSDVLGYPVRIISVPGRGSLVRLTIPSGDVISN